VRGEGEPGEIPPQTAIRWGISLSAADGYEKALKGKWILVVDDEEDILQMVYELLEMCKIDTATKL
jgi:hypothetical protein